MAIVKWASLPSGKYADFGGVILDNVKTFGVYVIWHGSGWDQGRAVAPWSVRLGQGDIKTRLCEHRDNPLITQYAVYGGLYVTWAAVPALIVDGVERYLAEQLLPKVGNRFPDATAIPVNLPWAA
jgi:hypothetical protein